MANLPLSCTNSDDPAGAAFFCFAAVAPPKMKIVAVATTRTSLEFMRINIDTLLRYVRIYPRLASLKTRQLCNGSLPQTSLRLRASPADAFRMTPRRSVGHVTAGAFPPPEGPRSCPSRGSPGAQTLLPPVRV